MRLKHMVHKGGILFFCPNKDLVRVSHVHLNYKHMGLKSSICPVIYSISSVAVLMNLGACSHTPKSGPSVPDSDAARDQILRLQEKIQDLEIRLTALNDKINLENSATLPSNPHASPIASPPTAESIGVSTSTTAPVVTAPITPGPTPGLSKVQEIKTEKVVPVAAAGRNIPPAFASDESIDRFREAKILFDTKRYPDAILEFAAFLKNHPDHPLAASAQYHLGMSYLNQKEYKLAEEELSRGLISYPHSSHIPDTLLSLSRVSSLLNKETKSIYYREKLQSRFPNSPQSKAVLEARTEQFEEPKVVSGVKDSAPSAPSVPEAPESPKVQPEGESQ